MIYVVLPVHNRIAATQRCVRCLQAQTFASFHLVLVDDGCADGTPQWVQGQMAERLTILRGDGNLWWAGALQLAYEWIRGERLGDRPAPPADAVLVLNDDVTFGPEFLAEGLACLDADRGRWIQAVASAGDGEPPDRGVEADLRRLRFHPARDAARINCLSTRGLMLDLAAFAGSGGFRPRLLPHYLSDYEFTLRGARRGARLTSCETFHLRMDSETTGLREMPRDGLIRFVRSAFSNKSAFNPVHASAFVLLCCPAWSVPLNLTRVWGGFLRGAIAAALTAPK